MAAQDLLRNKVDETPTIYAYTLPDVPKYKGLLKVGYTSRPGTIRIMEQGHELYLDTIPHTIYDLTTSSVAKKLSSEMAELEI